MLYATDSCSDVHPRGAQTICALLSSTKVLTHDMALLMLLSSSNSTCLELSLQQSHAKSGVLSSQCMCGASVPIVAVLGYEVVSPASAAA